MIIVTERRIIAKCDNKIDAQLLIAFEKNNGNYNELEWHEE